jgi:hypothetical protein
MGGSQEEVVKEFIREVCLIHIENIFKKFFELASNYG